MAFSGLKIYFWLFGVSACLAHRNRSDFCDLRLRCPSRTPEIARFRKQDKAMLHCDLRVRWKVASDLRFRAAISETKTPSCCGICGDLAPSTRKSLAIAIVRFWCAKVSGLCWGVRAIANLKSQLTRIDSRFTCGLRISMACKSYRECPRSEV